MAKPLEPSKVDELLRPNPAWWGPDAYPLRATFMDFPIIVDPALPPDQVRIVQDDGRGIRARGFATD